VTTNGTGSIDRDGVVVSYAWSFGDGGTATGATSSHRYGKAGKYSVALTVTDDDGAASTITAAVSVGAPPSKPGSLLASDVFSRKLKNSWGKSTLGGPWKLSGGSSSFSVSGGKGRITLTPSANRNATLPTVSTTSTVSKTKLALTVPKSGSVSLTLIGRQVGDSYYGARIVLSAGGVARVYALRDETQLGTSSYRVKGRYKSGKALQLKTQVSGTNPTTVKVKVWTAGKSEPSKWRLVATDSTAALQTAGSVGLKAYEGATATASTQIRLYDYRSVVGPA
jgi:PKD repeat protein